MIEAFNDKYGVDVSRSRRQDVVIRRFAIMTWMIEDGCQYIDADRIMGKRNGTARHAVSKFKDFMSINDRMAARAWGEVVSLFGKPKRMVAGHEPFTMSNDCYRKNKIKKYTNKWIRKRIKN